MSDTYGCANCGKPVGVIRGFWHHTMLEDYEGPCFWGKPFEPGYQDVPPADGTAT